MKHDNLEFKIIQEKSDSGFKIITSDFKSEFKIIQQKSDSEFKRLEDKIETKTTMLMWGMGIIMALIGILITILVASKFIHSIKKLIKSFLIFYTFEQ